MFYNVRDILYLSFQLFLGDKELLARQVGTPYVIRTSKIRLPILNVCYLLHSLEFTSSPVRYLFLCCPAKNVNFMIPQSSVSLSLNLTS